MYPALPCTTYANSAVVVVQNSQTCGRLKTARAFASRYVRNLRVYNILLLTVAERRISCFAMYGAGGHCSRCCKRDMGLTVDVGKSSDVFTSVGSAARTHY